MRYFKFLSYALATSALSMQVSFAQSTEMEPFNEAPPPQTPTLNTNMDLRAGLLADIPPQELLFDLRVGDKLLGSVPVLYTDSWVHITDIDAVIDRLSMVKTPENFRKLLSGKVMTDTPREFDGIGKLSVDPQNFLVNLTVAKESLIKQDLASEAKTFVPYDKWVLSNSIRATGTWDFQSDTDDRFSLDHKTAFGEGRWFVQARGFLPRSEGYNITDAAFNYHYDESTLKFGLLETLGQDFAYSRNFLGVSYSSELAAYDDLKNLRGSRLELYVPSRAQVDIYRGNRIIYSRMLDFGLQEIDTTRFPAGSYSVRAVITETNGNVTEEVLNYSKFLEISPRGKPEYNIQVGVARGEAFDFGTTPVYQAGLKWRYWDNLQAEFDIYGSAGLNMLEPGFIFFHGDDLRLEGAFAYSTAGDAGINFDLYNKGLRENDSWSLGYSNAFKGFDYDITQFTSDDFETYLSGQQERLNFHYNTRLSNDATLSFAAAYTDNGQDQRYNYGPRLRFDLLKSREHRIFSDTQLTMSSGSGRFFTSLTYRRNANPWRYEGSIGRGRQQGYAYWNQRNVLSYDKTESNGRGTSVQLTNDNYQHNGAVESNNDLLVNHQNDTLALRTYLRNASGDTIDQSEKLSVGGEITTSMIWTEDGHKAQLPKVSDRGMAVIDIVGDESIEAEFEVLVDGVARGYGRIGESVPVNLMPYETHSITLRATKGADLIKVEDKQEVVSILPGNIAQMQWRIDKSILLIGRLLDINGRPLAWKTIKGLDNFGTTDAFGNFQIEINARNQPFVDVKGSGICTLAVPELTFGEFYINIGDMVCV